MAFGQPWSRGVSLRFHRSVSFELSDIDTWSDRSRKMSEWNAIARHLVAAFLHCTGEYGLVLLSLDDVSGMDEMSWKILQRLYERASNLLVIATARNEFDLNINGDFWADLNEEIREQPKKSLHLAFNVWRWAITIYCACGAVVQLFSLPCAFGAAADTCLAWREPSLAFKDVFHSGLTNGFLGFWGIVGLVIYALYLGYFLVIRLGRQGRIALNQ